MSTREQELLGDLVPGPGHDGPGADLSALVPDADGLLDGVHARVRGLVHVTAWTTAPPMEEERQAYAALRSTAGMREAVDLITFLSEATTDTAKSLQEVMARKPIKERIADRYPGVELRAEKGPRGERPGFEGPFTLYARGNAAVISLFTLLHDGVIGMAVPDFPAQDDRVDFIRTMLRLRHRGRRRDAEDLAAAYRAAVEED